MAKKEKTKEDENCISSIIGPYGPFQQSFMIFFTIFYLSSPFNNYGIVFFTAKSDFWCSDQVGQNKTLASNLGLINQCSKECQSFAYDTSFQKSTIIQEWDLVCDRSYLTSMAASVFQLGYLVSSLVVGYCSDRYGRKKTYQVITLIEIASGFGQAFSPSIWVFIFARFFLGVASYGRYLTGKLLVMEQVGTRHRATCGLLVEYGWYIGRFLLIGGMYLLPHFRWSQIIVSCLQVIALFYFHLVPESIRWLISKKKYNEAADYLRKAAYANDLVICDLNKPCDGKITDEELNTKISNMLEQHKNNVENTIESKKDKPTFINFLRVPGMLGVMISFFYVYFANGLLNYSVNYNTQQLGNNLYANFAILNLSSFICVTILYNIIEKFDRKPMIRFAYGIRTFVICILAICFYYKFGYFLDSSGAAPHPSYNSYWMPKIEITLFFVFGFVTSASYHFGILLVAETAPTIMRQFVIGTCSVFMRFGSIFAPFTKELSYITSLSFVYFGFFIISFFTIVGSLFFVETRGYEIPYTISDCQRLKKDRLLIKQEAKNSKKKGLEKELENIA